MSNLFLNKLCALDKLDDGILSLGVTFEKIQKEARQKRLELIEKRNNLLFQQLTNQICGGMRDIATDKTVVKAKTLLTKNRLLR